MAFLDDGGALVAKNGYETLRIEPWGRDSLRVRAVMYDKWTGQDWALTEAPEKAAATIRIGEEDFRNGDGTVGKVPCAEIENGRIRATVNFCGVISFFRDGNLVLREYYRSYGGTIVPRSRCLKIVNREWKGIFGGGDFKLRVKFDANDGERIYGMGQYQQPFLDLKGNVLELAQRNS